MRKLMISVALLCAFFTGCKKDDNDTPPTVYPASQFNEADLIGGWQLVKMGNGTYYAELTAEQAMYVCNNVVFGVDNKFTGKGEFGTTSDYSKSITGTYIPTENKIVTLYGKETRTMQVISLTSDTLEVCRPLVGTSVCWKFKKVEVAE